MKFFFTHNKISELKLVTDNLPLHLYLFILHHLVKRRALQLHTEFGCFFVYHEMCWNSSFGISFSYTKKQQTSTRILHALSYNNDTVCEETTQTDLSYFTRS